jgi:hypothetical protein
MSTPSTESSAAADAKTSASAPVTDILAAADTSAAQSLQNLQLVHQARVNQLTRTATNLSAKLGATDPQVVAAQAAVAAATTTAARVGILKQQVSVAAPKVTATGWALLGSVFDSQNNPATNLTVFLVNAQKTYQQEYGFSYTDANGAFLINYPGTGEKARKPPTLYIQVANQSAKAVFLSSTAFQPASGSITYQNITIPAGQPLGDPPKAVRKIAFPPKEATS